VKKKTREKKGKARAAARSGKKKTASRKGVVVRNKVVAIGPNTNAIVPIDADENEVRARYGLKALPGKRGDEAVAPPAPSEPLPEPERRTIRIDEIDDAAAGGRTALENDDELSQLADSIKRSGLLQPIGVIRKAAPVKGKKYTLVWGYRRTLAMGLVGDATASIDAKVYPASAAGREEELRAIENVQRKDWNLIEEAMWVAKRLDQVPCGEDGATSLSARCRRVGSEIGKSESWVLDRSYLARLSGEARDLVASGMLPLQQAREIATLADPALRDRMADMAARKEDGSGGMDYERVARWCRQYRHSLRTVPWRMDVGFAGAPACATCPSNSANDLTLFAHDQDEHGVVTELGAKGAGLCMNQACFEKKRRAAEASINAGVAKVKAARKEDKALAVNATCLEEKKLIPPTIKVSSFVRKAQSEALPAKRASKDDDGKDLPGGGPKADTESPAARAKRNAREKFDEAEAEWQRDAVKRVYLALAKVPGAMVAMTFYVFVCNRMNALECAWGGSDTQARCAKLCQSPDIRELLRQIATGKLGDVRPLEEDVAKLLSDGRQASKLTTAEELFDRTDRWGFAVYETLAELAGVKLADRPVLDTFLEAQGVKPAAKDKDR
jgi:ParB/RepB/Spo0J family partition protein